MFTLSRLKDVTRFYEYGDNFRNEVYLITDDVPIKCNGILLAARSRKIEEIIKDTENIRANEYSDNLPALYDCLDLIYGSSVAIGRNNYKTIFKFGKIFDIWEMVGGVSNWISNDYSMFWDIFLDLTKLGLDRLSISQTFHDATCTFIVRNRTKVLTDALEICQWTDASTIKHIVELFDRSPYLSVDDMLKFLKDILASSTVTTSTLDKNINTVLSSMISYIDTSMCRIDYDRWFITTSSLYIDTLTTLTNFCNDVKLQRTIFSLQGDIHSLSMFIKEPSIRNLTRRVLDHLSENAYTASRKLCRFIFSPIHCVLLELALKDEYKYILCRLYADRFSPPCGFYEDLMYILEDMLDTITFSLEGHDQSCKDHVKMWCDNFLKDFIFEDDTYKQHATDIKRMSRTQERYLYYYFKTVPKLKEYVQDNTLPELKECITKR